MGHREGENIDAVISQVVCSNSQSQHMKVGGMLHITSPTGFWLNTPETFPRLLARFATHFGNATIQASGLWKGARAESRYVNFLECPRVRVESGTAKLKVQPT